MPNTNTTDQTASTPSIKVWVSTNKLPKLTDILLRNIEKDLRDEDYNGLNQSLKSFETNADGYYKAVFNNGGTMECRKEGDGVVFEVNGFENNKELSQSIASQAQRVYWGQMNLVTTGEGQQKEVELPTISLKTNSPELESMLKNRLDDTGFKSIITPEQLAHRDSIIKGTATDVAAPGVTFAPTLKPN